MLSAAYRYQAFGCQLESDSPLFSFTAMQTASDLPVIRIHFCASDEPAPTEWQTQGGFFRFNAIEFEYWVTDLVRFRCIGSDIWVEALRPDNMASRPLLEAHLTGPVLAAVLQRLGFTTLHANGVTDNDSAILICGYPSIGKSALAAALIKCGMQHFSDDMVCVHVHQQRVIAESGVQHLKLMPDLLQFFDISEAETTALSPQIPKQICQAFLSANVGIVPLPIKHILVLQRSSQSEPQLQHIKGIAAFELLKQQLFRPQFLPANHTSTAIQTLMQLVTQCRVWTLDIPTGLAQITEAATLVQTHLRQLS